MVKSVCIIHVIGCQHSFNLSPCPSYPSVRLGRQPAGEGGHDGGVRQRDGSGVLVVQPGDGGGAGPADAAANAQCDRTLQKHVFPNTWSPDR